jgi:hypothetical protein
MAMDSKPADSPIAESVPGAQGDEDLTMDQYLDLESIYKKDMKFYTEDNWP